MATMTLTFSSVLSSPQYEPYRGEDLLYGGILGNHLVCSHRPHPVVEIGALGYSQHQHRHVGDDLTQIPDHVRADAVGYQEVDQCEVDLWCLLRCLGAGLAQRLGLGDHLQVRLPIQEVSESLAKPSVIF